MDEIENVSNIAGFYLDGWYVLDNFAAFQVEWRGKLYPTSEHAYQSAHFFETAPEIAEFVRGAKSPREASDIANSHSDKDDPDWSEKKILIMEDIVRHKLAQHDVVRKTLLESGAKTIVETNPKDSFWGWGADRNGRNELGKIWMRLRDELSAKSEGF